MTAILKMSAHAGVVRRQEDRYIAVSPEMTELMSKVERVARLTWPVLITGETGAGKEGIAKALHNLSRRAHRPFVAVDAGTLPEDLVVSELFGHERGAFTGALAVHQGVFEAAQLGTLFLDEIGELSLMTQAKLLRVVETSEVRRIGSSVSRRVDVRLVCATNRNLREMVEAGTFRADLYHRIVSIVLEVPPLRERSEDLVELVEHFLEMIADDLGHVTLTNAARIRLAAHDWPGNVRELRNVLCSAAVATTHRFIEGADIDTAIERVGTAVRRAPSATSLAHAVELAGGNLAAAARALGIARTTLRDRLLAEAGRQ